MTSSHAHAHRSPSLSPALRALCDAMMAARDEPDAVPTALPAFKFTDPAALLEDLPTALRAGRSESYTRHVIFSDPQGAFTLVYLIWRPGQHSPVHGHRTWCGYRVLQGDLTETHYRWDAATETAANCGGKVRRAGDHIAASPGLGHIHRLGNDSDQVCISLHMYGVPREHIATGVNLLVAVA